MNKIMSCLQPLHRKTMMFFAILSCFAIESTVAALDVKKMSMQERCIASWLALSGQKASVFDGKILFDEIDPRVFPELSKFVKKHRCPVEIEKQILHHLSYKDRMINHFQNLSFIIIKGAAFDRLINADRMIRCIEVNNLDLINIAQKYLYRDGNFWGVAALQVDTCNDPIKLSLPEIQQLFILGMETGYRDWKFNCKSTQYRNFFYDKQGSLFCIDTEDLSFQVSGHSHYWQAIEYVPHDCKANYAMSLMHYKDYMEPEALAWLTAKVEAILKSDDAFTEYLSLPYNTKYDDPAINIAKVKQEYAQFMQNQFAQQGQQEYLQYQVQ